MKHFLLIAGAAMLASTGPAYAKPGHAKHAHKGQKSDHGQLWDDDERWDRGKRRGFADGCPPGLAKKTPRCMPPGQAKKQGLLVGQRVPLGARLLGYDQLPYDLRSQYGYGVDPSSRYAYDGGNYYRVDPTTMIVQQILGGILR